MKKKCNRWILIGIAAIAGAVSIAGNVVQYNQYNDLLSEYRQSSKEYRDTISEKDQEIAQKEENIESLQKDLEWETYIYEEQNADYELILDKSLEFYKEHAREDGFDPDKQDWIYSGAGKWYFFYYEEPVREDGIIEVSAAQ